MTATNLDSVRATAYAIWETRVKTGAPGDEMSDWLAAERLIAAVATGGDVRVRAPRPDRPVPAPRAAKQSAKR